MAMSSAYCVTWQVWVSALSLTNRMKRSGLRMLPCGVPASSCTTSESVFPILSWMVLSVRNEEIILRMSLGSSMSWNFFSRLLCHTASNAFSTSKSSSAASFLLSFTFFVYLLMIIMCSIASLCGWYARCHGLMILLSSMYSCILWTLASCLAKVSAVSFSELVVVLVDGFMSLMGFLSALV